jgi:cob(I)alamin adenosyltransferase
VVHVEAQTGAEPSATAPAGPPAPALQYLNRLSDLLFVLARIYARAGGGGEVLWRHRK